MSYSKTLICQETGITLTFIDDWPDGNYDSIRSHPQLENLHHRITKYKSRTPKSYLAGGILHTLKSCNRFAHVKHYPKNIMGLLNAELCEHDSEFLYSLYVKVQTFCYGKSIIREAQFNLASTLAGKWGIVKAIRILIREEDEANIPSNKYTYAINIAAAEMRKATRQVLSITSQPSEPAKLGNMNIEAVIKRVKELANKTRKGFLPDVQDIEKTIGLTVKEANILLPNYPLVDMVKRQSMASLYFRLAEVGKYHTITTPTQKRSFSYIEERLLDDSVNPIELTDGDAVDLDDLDLSML